MDPRTLGISAPAPLRPHGAGVWAGIGLPLLALPAAWATWLLYRGDLLAVDPGRAFAGLGLVLLLALLGAVACAVLLGFIAAGQPLPTCLPVLFGGLPWLAGTALAALSGSPVNDPTPGNPLDDTGLFGARLAEGVGHRFAGAVISGSLLLAVGLALAAAAAGQPALQRKPIPGATLGVVSALPLVGFVLFATNAIGPVGWPPIAASAAVLLGSMLAGASAGNDFPRPRAAALAAAGPAALAAGFVAVACAFRDRVVLDELFGASIGSWPPTAAAKWVVGRSLVGVAAPLSALPVLILLAWSWLLIRPEPPRWAGAAALAMVTALVVVLGLLARTSVEDLVRSLGPGEADRPSAARPGTPGVEPTAVPQADAASDSVVQPLRVGGDVTAPLVLTRIQPVYPEEARRARLSGIVIVEAIVDRHGNVGHVRVLKGLPMGLDRAAAEAIEQWKFQPATLHGEPVDVYFILTVNFQVQ